MYIMPKFQQGDVVLLKSGGPKMTIMDIKEEDGSFSYVCLWFVDHQNQKKETYPEAVLKKFVPPGRRIRTI